MDAPSFSLGLDFDDDDGDGDNNPPAPSFSLGLDLDPLTDQDEPEPEQEPPPDSTRAPSLAGDLQDLSDSDPDFIPPPVLKRLRRGTSRPPPANESTKPAGDEFVESSSQRSSRGECLSLPTYASCSSSKISLHDRGVLTNLPAKDPKILAPNTGSPSAKFNASSGFLFPKLTSSPLKRICLVDSDSDDPSPSKINYRDNKDIDVYLEIQRNVSSQSVTRKEGKEIFQKNKVQTESLWKDFSPKKNATFATPVLDEFCNEYFHSVEDANANKRKVEGRRFTDSIMFDLDDFEDNGQQKSVSRETKQGESVPNSQPPAYRYFYHPDTQIQALVRQRLSYFFPLNVENNRGNWHSPDENLDYMSQFSSSKNNSEGSSRMRERRPTDATEGWLNPKKSSVSIAKNAGNRRAPAGDEQSGHWFTRENGRKVYVTKNGKELTGRAAYRNYKKESGGVVKRRKKAAGKKVAGKKAVSKNSAGKKAVGKNSAGKKVAGKKRKR